MFKTTQLTFSVLWHYLPEFARKVSESFPISPLPFDSNLLKQAEQLVLGQMPEKLIHGDKLFSLFEGGVLNKQPVKVTSKKYSYDFSPLSPESIFPLQKMRKIDRLRNYGRLLLKQ